MPQDTPPTPSTFALRVVAHYYGVIVEETFAPQGAEIVLGNTDAIAVPVPQGSEYIARCKWTGRSTLSVLDGRGRQHTIVPDEPVNLIVGPVRLELSVVPRYLVVRSGDSRWWEAMPWLSMVLAATLLMGQSGILVENRCPWLGGINPSVDEWLQCEAEQGGGSGLSDFPVAEYLERLLQEDYAGEDRGIISDSEHEDAEREREDYYLPAGQDGDVAQMGGAEDVGPDEIRTPEAPEEAIAEAGAAEEEPEMAIETDSPVVEPEPEPLPVEDEGIDGVAEAEPTEELGEEEEMTPPEEEKEGWGVQDWYDEADARREAREIEFMTEYANQRLRIDPNDPGALSILSYYQYLDEDFEGALATYDKYIAQLPEEGSGYNNKALVYKRQGDYETEERLYRIALAFSPNDVTTLNNLAVCLAHQGKIAEAKLIMEQLETLDPGDAYAELHRAKIYAESGETEKVYEHLRLALQGMAELDTLHHIEFRQDIRVDPSFESMRRDPTFRAILIEYYGKETPLQ